METIGTIDYRPEMQTDVPSACPVCGGEIAVEDKEGQVYVGPADLRSWAARFVEIEGRYRTLSLRWHCVADPDHEYGPILYA